MGCDTGHIGEENTWSLSGVRPFVPLGGTRSSIPKWAFNHTHLSSSGKHSAFTCEWKCPVILGDPFVVMSPFLSPERKSLRRSNSSDPIFSVFFHVLPFPYHPLTQKSLIYFPWTYLLRHLTAWPSSQERSGFDSCVPKTLALQYHAVFFSPQEYAIWVQGKTRNI